MIVAALRLSILKLRSVLVSATAQRLFSPLSRTANADLLLTTKLYLIASAPTATT
jgi:hypothetical protein